MKNTKFIGNKIPVRLYTKLVNHSDETGKKKQRIMTEALEDYFRKTEEKNEPQKDKTV